MRLKPEQLAAHLERGIAPIYLVSGEEPLQMVEAADLIRAAAGRHGYAERQVFHAEGHFDWDTLLAASDSLSLFAERRLIELRISGSKMGDGGAKALSAYAQRPAEDTVLLVTCGKLDKRQQQSKWFQALERGGVFVPIWPVERAVLAQWVQRRMQARGLRPNTEAVALLCERAEGNLLAAAQEIDKLTLLYGPSELDAEAVRAAVADSSRFDVFELADAALLGEAQRVVRIVDGLRAEGVEPILVLWALAREARSLAVMAHAAEAGEDPERVLARQGVWEKRKRPVRAGLKRHTSRRWRDLLRAAGRVDRVIKGAEPGTAWDELLQLALAIARRHAVLPTDEG